MSSTLCPLTDAVSVIGISMALFVPHLVFDLFFLLAVLCFWFPQGLDTLAFFLSLRYPPPQKASPFFFRPYSWLSVGLLMNLLFVSSSGSGLVLLRCPTRF